MERRPEEIIEKIKEFYKDDFVFLKSVQSDGTIVWTNKEVRLSVTKEGEHSIIDRKKHPVVTIDVCYDKERKTPIQLDWNQAYTGYIRN